jgi:plasmid stabilization system protein ParE
VIRQLIYGGRRGRYRILYVVRGKEVRVLHVRHGAQRRMSGDEIEG